MRCPSSCEWRQGDSHPLGAIHYALIFQAVLGFVIIIIVTYALLHLGWWTRREIAAALAIGAGATTVLVVLPIQVFVGYVSPAEKICVRRVKTSVGTFLALLLFGLYGAAGVTMVQSPGKDFRKSFDNPPYGTWWAATTLVFAQCIMSGCSAYRILLYFFKPLANQVQMGNVSDSDLDDIPLTNISHTNTSQAASTNGVSRLSSVNDASQTYLQETEQHVWSQNVEDADEESAGPTKTRHLSAKARGKQREIYSDGCDELDWELAYLDAEGGGWSPIR